MSVLPADDLVVRPAHLMLALGCESRTLSVKLSNGEIPQPDARKECGLKLWKLATIRAWNPALAADLEQLLAIPSFASRPSRRIRSRLLNAA